MATMQPPLRRTIRFTSRRWTWLTCSVQALSNSSPAGLSNCPDKTHLLRVDWQTGGLPVRWKKVSEMKHYPYLIIGGGLAGDAAVRGIRELDTKGSIGMLSTELNAPYTRPDLSKGLWKGRPLEKIWRNTESLGAEL